MLRRHDPDLLEKGQKSWFICYLLDTFAPSNLPQAIREAGAVAANAEQIKEAKYARLDPSHLFIPIAFETSRSLGPMTAGFIKELTHLIRHENDKPSSPSIPTPEIVCCHPEGECCLYRPLQLCNHFRLSAILEDNQCRIVCNV